MHTKFAAFNAAYRRQKTAQRITQWLPNVNAVSAGASPRFSGNFPAQPKPQASVMRASGEFPAQSRLFRPAAQGAKVPYASPKAVELGRAAVKSRLTAEAAKPSWGSSLMKRMPKATFGKGLALGALGTAALGVGALAAQRPPPYPESSGIA